MIKPSTSTVQPEVLAAFKAYESHERLNKSKVGCIMVMTLMPLGVPMDYYVYGPGAQGAHPARPEHWLLFCVLRLCSAILGAGIWAVLTTERGKQFSKWLGLVVPLVPVFFIAWMIAVAEGFNSPYYSGLNLVLLAVGSVLNWSFLESLASVTLVLLIYLATGLLHSHLYGGQVDTGILINNLFFIGCMDVMVVVGSFFQYRARFREFVLRYELDRSSRALEESNQKLMELDQVKSRFFANISHELRTPLTLLLAPLEMLLQRFNRSLDQETRQTLMTMYSNGMRLLKLINDLLDLVRLESGRMEVRREPVEVEEFIKGLASAARQVAEDKRLRLETYVDPAVGTVMADRDKLEKVILNLLFNALKFTLAGGRVELRAEKRDEEMVLMVVDTGMGISEKNLSHVFDRFWQADGSSKRKYQGVGIGLALVKELVEIQGGKVTVQSEEGKGTTFTVTLPYQKADPVEQPEVEVAAQITPDAASGGTFTSEEWLTNLYRRAELFPALTPLQASLRPVEAQGNGSLPTILVADDEPDMLRFLKSQLSPHYRVLEAVDGQQAIEKASQFLPEVILLDMMMPEKDGLQACREIREHIPTQSIPIILLTARADEETKLAALSAGASDFLTKPFSTTELHVRLKNLVESHQYQRKVSKQNQALESTIEQLKDTETQLVQTEKLASLGRFSAGIIHEINNPLNFATTGLYTLRNKGKYLAPEQQEEYAEILKDVEEGIKRVKTIVSDLRMFSHPEVGSRDQVEVPEVVGAALRLLSAEWKDKVRVEQKLAEHQTIWANKNLLIHTLLNLLQNSIHALKAKSFETEQPTIWIESRLERDKSLLVIRDNGTGIEDKHLNKIFDPFYTTKDVGEGMGLGLAMCHRIVQDCEGQISVRTEPGKFCEFTLEFPAKGQQ